MQVTLRSAMTTIEYIYCLRPYFLTKGNWYQGMTHLIIGFGKDCYAITPFLFSWKRDNTVIIIDIMLSMLPVYRKVRSQILDGIK